MAFTQDDLKKAQEISGNIDHIVREIERLEAYKAEKVITARFELKNSNSLSFSGDRFQQIYENEITETVAKLKTKRNQLQFQFSKLGS